MYLFIYLTDRLYFRLSVSFSYIRHVVNTHVDFCHPTDEFFFICRNTKSEKSQSEFML